MEQDAAARGQRGQCERVAAVEWMMAGQWQHAAKQLCAVLMRGGEGAGRRRNREGAAPDGVWNRALDCLAALQLNLKRRRKEDSDVMGQKKWREIILSEKQDAAARALGHGKAVCGSTCTLALTRTMSPGLSLCIQSRCAFSLSCTTAAAAASSAEQTEASAGESSEVMRDIPLKTATCTTACWEKRL